MLVLYHYDDRHTHIWTHDQQYFLIYRELLKPLSKRDTLWLLLGILLLLGGLAGCLVPLLPGPPLCYAALLLLQLNSHVSFSFKFLLIWAVVVAVVTLLDYVIPLYGTRKFGGTPYGIWGCTLGLLAGFWLGPLGIVFGPFMGAFMGE